MPDRPVFSGAIRSSNRSSLRKTNPGRGFPGPGLTACQLEITSSFYQQVINTGGTTEREFHFNLQNSGSLACLGTVLLNYMD
jgi:hypothetical protein